MRTRSLLIGAIAAVSSAVGGIGLPAVASADGASPFIVGGHDATEDYSFMVSLQKDGQHGCGASLIKPDWAVTAKHCVEGEQPSSFTVRIGSKDHSAGGEEAKVSDIKVHETGDIAVFKLDHAVKAKPINIAKSSGDPGAKTRIIGWGQTCPEQGCGEAPKTLQELDVSVVDDAKCGGDIKGPNEICTENPNNDAGACYGDSGGPQIIGTPGNWELTGATSRAGNNNPTCGKSPSIYTDVVSYGNWVNGQVGG